MIQIMVQVKLTSKLTLAINGASGDTIIIGPGTFRLNLTVSENLTILQW